MAYDQRTTMCHVFIALHTEKSLRHVAMEAKFPDLNKPWSCKYDTNDFPVHHCTQEQNGNPYFFFHGFDNAKCHLCQERLLRYRNFTNMVKWRHASFELIANWHFFAFLGSRFVQIFGKILLMRVETLCNTNWQHQVIKNEKGTLPVDMRRSKTTLLGVS